LILYI